MMVEVHPFLKLPSRKIKTLGHLEVRCANHASVICWVGCVLRGVFFVGMI